jgi:(R,R)-butanediol dehydrogenase/meso-butanediol dehydrogenase/diacetyl reductase
MRRAAASGCIDSSWVATLYVYDVDVALITGKERVEIIEFDQPEPPVDGVVVDIALCGVCGTDVHAWQSGSPYTPAICGHEWTGTVSAAGADVRSVAEGDRVVVAVPPACGRCAACVAGQQAMCLAVFAHATGRHPSAPVHGGFAPAIAVAQGRVVRLDAAISDAEAAQVEPLTVTLHAVRRSGLRSGEFAVVQGAGPIGLLTAQLVRSSGAGRTVVIEPNAARRALALTLGADLALHPDEASATILELTNGLGADVVYECAGIPATVQSAVDLTRRGGTMCLIGLASGPATIDPRIWLVKEITVRAALAYTHEEFAMAIGLIADGRVNVDALHTSTVGLTGLDQALAGLSSGGPDMKVLVDPRAA